MLITPAEITNTIGSPIANTQKYWPMIVEELKRTKSNKVSFQCALLATIGVEAGLFKPIHELGGPKYFTYMYDIQSTSAKRRAKAVELGNLDPGDGIKFHGRSFIQLTGFYNYLAYGRALGYDLISNPDKALEDEPSVRILVKFCLDHGVNVWADRAWRTDDDESYPEEMCLLKIRRLVNGGLMHYDKFKRFYHRFKELSAA